MTPRNPVRYAVGCPCCVQDGRRRGRSRLVTKRPDSGLNEINLKSGGKVEVDTDTLRGTVLGKPGKVVRPRANSSSKVSINRLNWLGYVAARQSRNQIRKASRFL